MSSSELFSCDDPYEDAEIERVFNDMEASHLLYSVSSDPGGEAYLAKRRQLLGPVADITHPEFGRPNRPEETFCLFYRITKSPAVELDETEVDEYVYDRLGNVYVYHEGKLIKHKPS